MLNVTISEQDRGTFTEAHPFPHIIYDNFFDEDIARQLSEEVPGTDNPIWLQYNNKLENKFACNMWDKFPKTTYQVFSYFCNPNFVSLLSQVTGIFPLIADVGLHGGGWHVHTRGGMLNVHKDYSIHPKMKLERALNLIVYLTPNWNSEWGGGLGLWTEKDEQPDELIHTVDCLFNRAVLFDTRKNSWHGLPQPIECPDNVRRTSIAIYYMTTPSNSADLRERALYAPSPSQRGDQEILDFIQKRAKA